jgi:3-oxoacyl-[acyl-carrier protein] reductase
MRLQGKNAVVTGASRGIGLAVAKALHEAGANVAITGREDRTLQAAAGSIGPRARGFVCDQQDRASIEAMADHVLQAMGPPDVLVNNAGVMRGAPVAEMSPELWNEVLQTNLTGVFLTTRAFLPSMLELPRADIFMISSMSGKKGDPGAAAYAASKFGLQGFSQALMYEVRKHDIRVMVLNPSSVAKDEDDTAEFGPGLHLHARDLAATIVHLAQLPGRTMFRDMDIFGTNP